MQSLCSFSLLIYSFLLLKTFHQTALRLKLFSFLMLIVVLNMQTPSGVSLSAVSRLENDEDY